MCRNLTNLNFSQNTVKVQYRESFQVWRTFDIRHESDNPRENLKIRTKISFEPNLDDQLHKIEID